jgi:hypothetical protein
MTCMGEKRKLCNVWVESLKERVHSKDRGIVGGSWETCWEVVEWIYFVPDKTGSVLF